MIRLDLKREPYWLDMAPGVRIRVRPCTTALVMAARASMTTAEPAAGPRDEVPGGDPEDDNARGAALLKAMARVAIVDWEGIGDEAGAATPPSPERIDALLDLYPAFPRLRDRLLPAGAGAGRGKKRLRARAKWHFGGGPEYCGGCLSAGAPCAKGEPGADSKCCPYVETAPVSMEGWQAWDIASKCAGQLRLAPIGGVSGLDFAAAFACGRALGYDLVALAELLPAAEAGMVAALNERLNLKD